MLKFYSPKGPFFSFETREGSSATPSVSHHYHNYYEFYFLTSGTCRYLIGNTTYDLLAGDIVIIPKGIIHKTAYDSPTYQRKLICCSSHFMPSAIIDLLFSMPNIYRNSETATTIQHYLKMIEGEYQSQLPFREEVLTHYFQLLLLTLVRGLSHATSVTKANTQISEILDYLKKNYKNSCDLNQIASQFSISSEHLSRIFKKETGMNFSEYRTILRLQEAERLLKNNSSLTIVEVALESGFNDSNYFSQKFKEFYGVSPSKFRKS